MASNQNSGITLVQAVTELRERLAHLNILRRQSEPTKTWWFPYLKPDKSRSAEVDETTRSIGSVLGMSDARFDTLYRAAGRKWKAQLQIQYKELSFGRPNMRWIAVSDIGVEILDPVTPDQQYGRITANELVTPPWVKLIPLYRETEQEYANDTDDEIYDNEDADVPPPKKLGRKKNSSDGLVEWKVNKNLVVMIPPRYILTSKVHAKKASDRMQVMVTDFQEGTARKVEFEKELQRLSQELSISNALVLELRTMVKNLKSQVADYNTRPLDEDDIVERRQSTIAAYILIGMRKVCVDDLGSKQLGTRSNNTTAMLKTAASLVMRSLQKEGRIREISTSAIANATGIGRKLLSKVHLKLIELDHDNEPFCMFLTLLDRKERKDSIRPLSKQFVQRYCHSDDNAHHIDSNNLSSVKVKGDENSHIIRIWENVLTQDEKYKDFKRSAEYNQFKALYPDFEISLEVFLEQTCPCIKDPQMRSCVDLDYSALENTILAVREVLKTDPIMKNALELCRCPIHQRPQPRSTTRIHQVAREKSVRDILDMTYCKPVRDPFMAVGAGSGMKIPRFFQWDCVDGNCNNCGITKTFPELEQCPHLRIIPPENAAEENENDENGTNEKPLEFDALEKNEPKLENGETLHEVKVWCSVKIQNSKSRQMEPRTKKKSWKQLIYRLKVLLDGTRQHHAELHWFQQHMKILVQMIDPKLATTIATDFGATANLSANEADNSTIDGHAILAIFYHFLNQRTVEFLNENGDRDYHKLVQTMVTQYIGQTISRGKSHDWKFHGCGLFDLIKENEITRVIQYDDRRNANGERVREEKCFTYFIITDGCASQYKCRQNFLNETRICCEKIPNKIQIIHLIATKYGFKGPWDADGGRSKSRLRSEEIKGNRSPDAFSAFATLFNTMTKSECRLPIETFVQDMDPRIIQKTPMMMDSRRYRYICDDLVEYNNLVAKHAGTGMRILHLDRDLSTERSDPGTAMVGTKVCYQFHLPWKCTEPSTAVKAPVYECILTKRCCACLNCRKGLYARCVNRADNGFGDGPGQREPKRRKMHAKVAYQFPNNEENWV